MCCGNTSIIETMTGQTKILDKIDKLPLHFFIPEKEKITLLFFNNFTDLQIYWTKKYPMLQICHCRNPEYSGKVVVISDQTNISVV